MAYFVIVGVVDEDVENHALEQIPRIAGVGGDFRDAGPERDACQVRATVIRILLTAIVMARIAVPAEMQ